jgi:trk system potassium uptake protein TrkH
LETIGSREARALAEKRTARVLYVSPLLRHSMVSLAAAGITHLLSAVTGFFSGDVAYSLPILTWAVLYLGISGVWFAWTRPSRSLTKTEAFILVALAWIFTPLFSAIPVTAVMHIPLIDTWFESISGYTTTGLTTFTGGVDPYFHKYIPSVEEAPPTILWWRAYCQWLGGFGIVVMFFVFARLGGLPAHLVGLAEGRYQRLEPSIAKSLRALMGTYFFLTLIDAILLYKAGMTLSDAVYHSMTALATGGFSTHSSSIGFYHSVKVELAAIAGMIMGASNFADIYTLLTGKRRRLSGEINSLLIVIAVSVSVSALILWHIGVTWAPYHPLREAAFHAISAITGTGFGISDLSKAHDIWKLILSLLMLIGGSVLSTTGGIKQYRLMIMFKNLWWAVKETVYSGIMVTRRVGGYKASPEELLNAFAVITYFFLTWMIGTIALIAFNPEYKAIDAAFEAASALGTVGLSVGIASATASFSAKVILMILMLLGRLEVIGFFYALEVARRKLRYR